MQNNQNPREIMLGLSGASEISILDVLVFLKQAYKTILIFGALGALAAIIYLVVTPKQYEALAQITMAQIVASNNGNINPPATNIEEPALLTARLSNPTSFTPEAIAACGLEGQPNASALLAKAIKIAPAKGLPNIVDLKTFGASPEAAEVCANGIYALIQKSQLQIMAPYLEEVQIRLADDQERLERAKDLVSRSDKGGAAMSATYLSTRDEIRYLLDDMTGLKNILSTSHNRTTRLIAPIYTSNLPVEPKKLTALMTGLFSGLFLGLLISLGGRMIIRARG